MKLVTFEVATPLGAERRVGLMTDDRILDARAAYGAYLANEKDVLDYEDYARGAVPCEMLSVIRGGKAILETLRTAREYYERSGLKEFNGARLIYSRDEIRLLAPLPRPVSMRDFSAFPKHHQGFARAGVFNGAGKSPEEEKKMMEGKFDKERPFNYRTSATNVAGPDDVLGWPTGEDENQMDYELELAMYVGKPCRDVPPEEALDYLFGVSLYNDVTCHDILTAEHAKNRFIDKGKNFTGANILGPCIVTMDEIDIHDLRARVYHNGVLRGEETTAAMALKPEDIISYLSRSDYLMPGEVVGTGTFSEGTLREFGETLRPGDEIVMEGEGIGTMKTVVGPKPVK